LTDRQKGKADYVRQNERVLSPFNLVQKDKNEVQKQGRYEERAAMKQSRPEQGHRPVFRALGIKKKALAEAPDRNDEAVESKNPVYLAFPVLKINERRENESRKGSQQRGNRVVV